MRKLCLISAMIVATTYSSYGQVRNEYFRSLFIDAEINGGFTNQKIKSIPFATNYTDALNSTQSGIKFREGRSKGYSVRLGYYFNKSRSIGIGTGINYYKEEGTLSMDTFHIEYRATDYQGGTFRQVISSTRRIEESITTKSYNIPLLLHYKYAFNEKLCFLASAGIMYNYKVQNSYSSSARFDYEAIYKFEGTFPVYDNSAVPDTSSLLMTQAYYTTKYPGADVKEYFRLQDSIGYSVGLNQKVVNNSGSVTYKSGSLGYTAEVAAIYKVYRNVYLKLGAYYTGQSFTNKSNNNSLRLTDAKIKDASGNTIGVNYNSLLNEVQSVYIHNYGLTFGVRVYINKSAWKPENDMNKVTPASGHGQ
ncbi:MAG: hypothetical protein V4649_13925 [Bacteroidota bacterium]